MSAQMSLAVIAGQGALPSAIKSAHPGALICAMAQFAPDLDIDLPFRLETLGSLLGELKTRGVTHVCFAGAMARVAFDPSQLDSATIPLVPRVMAALSQGGDDAALRAAAMLFEESGFTIKAAHDLVPDLLPEPGLLVGSARPEKDAAKGMALLGMMSAADLGQSCVIRDGRVLAVEAALGTDWMLESLAGQGAGAVFIKAPKDGQDRRFDLPAIGPATVTHAQRAGITAIIIAAGGVMVLDRAATLAAAESAGITIWVRPA